ncbi:MAG: hypothetical protein IPL32_03830 [Chloracidobacterium sp.]|nr:hypothetical protein [Chloracidobacterium sp.]
MERIQYFLLPSYGKEHHKTLRLVGEVTGIDLPTEPEDIWALFKIVTGQTQLTTHFYCRTDLAQNDHSISVKPPDQSVYEPVCGWHDIDIFSVSYDDIEVLIDRQIDGEVEVRVWRNGQTEDNPYAKMTFEVYVYICGHCARNDVESAQCKSCEFCTNCCSHNGAGSELFHVVRNIEDRRLHVWPLSQLIAEINRDRSGSWSNYTAKDWEGGWQEFVEGKEYELVSPASGFETEQEAKSFCDEVFERELDKKVSLTQVYESLEAAIDAVCDQDTQNAIADEYRRQIRLRYETDKQKSATWIAKAQEVYRGIGTELQEVKHGN